MKLQKRISWWSGVVALLSLILAFILHWFGQEFIANIFIGLFSSGILICISAILTYLDYRKSELRALYIGYSSFQNTLSKNLRSNNQIDSIVLKENLESIMESYKTQIYCHVCELLAIRKNTKLYCIVNDFFEAIRHIYLLVCEDREMIVSFLLQNISLEEMNAYEFKHVGSEAVAYIQQLNAATQKLAVYLNYDSTDEKKEDSNHAD